jgi:hypothetical protein
MTRSKVFLTVLGVEREQAVRHSKRVDQLRRELCGKVGDDDVRKAA